mgnify:CR=1 FL=1
MAYDDVQKRIDERIKIKDNQRSDTELSIRISWAVNNAVAIMAQHEATQDGIDEIRLDELVNFFLQYFDQKKAELINNYEQEYQQNPTPTVIQYEEMSEAQRQFLKDKQLEKNRAAYAARKDITPEQSLADRVAQKAKMSLMDFKKLNDERTNG